MPKCHMVFVWGLMNAIYDVPMLLGDRKTSNLGEAGKATYIPQILNAIIEMVGPISYYPFTQVI